MERTSGGATTLRVATHTYPWRRSTKMPMVWSGQASLACPQPAINKSSAEAVLDGDGRGDERSGARPDLSAARRKRTGVRARDGWATPNVRVRRGQREAARVGLGNAFGPRRCAAKGKGEAGCCFGLGQKRGKTEGGGKRGLSQNIWRIGIICKIFYELVVLQLNSRNSSVVV